MTKPSFTTIGISILLVINLAILSFLFFNHSRRPGFHGMGPHHGKAGMHPYGPERGFPGCANSPADYHEGLRKHHRFGNGAMSNLNLSEDQKQKMEALRKEEDDKMESIMKKMGDLHQKEVDLLKNGKLDEAQMNSIAAGFGEYHKELHLNKLQHLQKINAILTPEQREKFGKEFGEHRRMGHGSHEYQN